MNQSADEIGRPLFWSLDTHIEAVVGMIRADELQIALQMLEQVPAWYRMPEHYPAELTEIKSKLYQGLYDCMQYGNDDEEANCTREFGEEQFFSGYCFPRAQIVSDIVKESNCPWLMDLGCSHGNMGLGLIKAGLSFNYLGKSINHRIAEKVKNWMGQKYWLENPGQNQKKILICTEVIEHCMNPVDVVQAAYKMGHTWDVIVLSVPLGTLGGGLENWDSRPLGHVRTWNKNEFVEFANKHWPGYKWSVYLSPSMVLVGRNNA